MEHTIEEKDLKKHSVLSTLSLFFQTGYTALLGLFANLVLTVIVSPKIYGIYNIVLAFIGFMNYFSDIGLAASLVQKKEITPDDVKTTFTVQQILIISVIIIGFLITPFVINFYKLPDNARYLYWALLLGFFISSLKTIPSIFLERKIQFQKIVLVQAIEGTVFYIVVSVAALSGMGLDSFTVAFLSRAVVGLIVMYSISFWMPQIGISKSSLKSLLSFGAPFQASSFLALIKDEFTTLFLGKVLGLEGLGYIAWAKKWAEAPIRIIMDSISRVMFPIFSRIQQDTQRIGKLINKILYYQTLLLAPTLAGMTLILPRFVHLIPKYAKWEPAIPLFYLFVLSAFFSTYSSPFINLFNALGKAKLSFKFMVYWTVATWVLTPVLTNMFGYYGFPLTLVFLSLTFIYIIIVAKNYVEFDYIGAVYPAIVCSCIMYGVVFAVLQYLPLDWISTIIAISIGGISYLIAIITIFQINPLKEIKELFNYG